MQDLHHAQELLQEDFPAKTSALLAKFIVGRRTPNSSVAEILFKSEGLRRDFAQSNQARQGTTRTTDKSVALGSGKSIANCLPAELYHHGTVVNQDANNGHVVVYEE